MLRDPLVGKHWFKRHSSRKNWRTHITCSASALLLLIVVCIFQIIVLNNHDIIQGTKTCRTNNIKTNLNDDVLKLLTLPRSCDDVHLAQSLRTQLQVVYYLQTRQAELINSVLFFLIYKAVAVHRLTEHYFAYMGSRLRPGKKYWK